MNHPTAIIPDIPLSSWYDSQDNESIEDHIVQLIINKITPDEQDSFMNATLQDIPDPKSILGMSEAVDLLLDTIRKGKKTLIVGDYDVDGITSTVLLSRFFQKMGYSSFESFIPNRFRHGYGLTRQSVDDILLMEPDLVITVDNGITAGEEIERLKAAGSQVIVTDHHLPQEGVVPDCIIINPKQKACPYPYKDLSGVGVAFMLVIAMRAEMRRRHFWETGKEPNLLHHLDLVAIGTIADQVPLLGLNRVFARFGLEQMTQRIQRKDPDTFFHYLKVFAKRSNVRFFDSNSIAFRLAPMLNATGRMKDAMAGVCFLLSETEQTAISRYNYIERLNLKRRKKQNIMVKKAMDVAQKLVAEKKGLLIYDDSFHEGLIGVVASRLSEHFNQPCIVATDSESGLLKASCRAKKDNIMSILQSCESHLERYGGHVNAAGFTLKKEKLNEFHRSFSNACNSVLSGKNTDVFNADIEVTLDMLTYELIERLKVFEPFGQNNSKTVFMIQNQPLPLPVVMTGKHLKWALKPDLEMIHWNGAHSNDYEAKFDIAFTLAENFYRGEKKRQLIIQAIIPSTIP